MGDQSVKQCESRSSGDNPDNLPSAWSDHKLKDKRADQASADVRHLERQDSPSQKADQTEEDGDQNSAPTAGRAGGLAEVAGWIDDRLSHSVLGEHPLPIILDEGCALNG